MSIFNTILQVSNYRELMGKMLLVELGNFLTGLDTCILLSLKIDSTVEDYFKAYEENTGESYRNSSLFIDLFTCDYDSKIEINLGLLQLLTEYSDLDNLVSHADNLDDIKRTILVIELSKQTSFLG